MRATPPARCTRRPPPCQLVGHRGDRKCQPPEITTAVRGIDRREIHLRGQQRRDFGFVGGYMATIAPPGRQRRHQPAPPRDHLWPASESDRHACYVGRGDLAHGMTGHHVGHHTPVLEQRCQRHLHGEQRGLRELRTFAAGSASVPHITCRSGNRKLRIQRRCGLVRMPCANSAKRP